MTPTLIFSASDLAHRLNLDRRAVLRRIEKLQITPASITPNGEPFYLMETVEALMKASLE